MVSRAKPSDAKRRGRPKAITAEEHSRRVVELAVAAGIPVVDIAALLGVSEPTLRKEFSNEIAVGHTKANAKIARRLFAKAMSGDTACLIFWAKTRMGWRETSRTELTGADGGPIQHVDVTKLTDEELEQIVNGDADAKGKGSRGA